MAVKNDWWFPAWNTAVRQALRYAMEESPGAFDAVFEAVGPLSEERAELTGPIRHWDRLRIEGVRLSFSEPIVITEASADGSAGPVVAEVFDRFHDDAERQGGCLFVRAAGWRAFVVTQEDRVGVLLRSDSMDAMRRATLAHDVRLNPPVPKMPGGATCGIVDGGPAAPIVLLYEHRRRPRWIRVDMDRQGCTIDLRQTILFRETAVLLGGIVRGKRPVRDFFRGGMPLFSGDVTGTLTDTGDRWAVLCLALVMRTMVWKHESSG